MRVSSRPPVALFHQLSLAEIRGRGRFLAAAVHATTKVVEGKPRRNTKSRRNNTEADAQRRHQVLGSHSNTTSN